MTSTPETEMPAQGSAPEQAALPTREAGSRPAKTRGELKPILASWLTDREEFVGTVKDTGYRAGHTVAWHTVHSPLHVLRILRYAPRGLWRASKTIVDCLSHAESRSLRKQELWASHTKEYLALKRDRDATVYRRLVALGLLSAMLAIGAVLLLAHLPVIITGWVFGLLGVVIVALLGYIGRPMDKPLIPRASDRGGYPPLRPDLILKALVALGIPKMTEPDQIRILTDLTREGDMGSSVDIELPEGVTAGEVLEKRSKLAAGLRRPVSTVWPGVGKRHEAHLALYVSNEPMATAKQKVWPLLKSGSVDVFKPAPAFTDQRGQWVTVTLAYTSGVIGAVPRVGKTFALRELLLIGALDPRCKIYAYDLKGTGDLSPLKLVAHRYGVGDEPEDTEQQLVEVRELRQELRRRVKVIRDLPDTVCPDNKVTTELASQRDLGLEPIFVGADECQVWMEHEVKAVREEFIAICTDLVKRGPAVGIMCYFATQKPDAKSLPTAIADNAIIRFCLMVHGWRSNDQVLGTGAHERGIRATMLAFEDKGIGYFKGEGPDTQLVRTVVGLDAVAAGKIALRARGARQQANRLTGYAAGEELEREVEEVILLDDVRQVMGLADSMHLTDLVTGLASLRPGAWGSLDAASLASQLRTAGVQVASVHVSGKPRYRATGKGVKRKWLDVDTTVLVGNSDPEDNVRELRPPPC